MLVLGLKIHGNVDNATPKGAGADMIVTPDLVNGTLEFTTALLVLASVRKLIIDKHVSGVSLFPSALSDLWGFWNMYYYPSLDQWWSFTGGCFLCAFNIWWTVLAFYYSFYAPVSAMARWAEGEDE